MDDIGIKLDELKGNIEFKNVSFMYPNREEVVYYSCCLIKLNYKAFS